MFGTIIADLSICLGLCIILLPLVITELSRPRDGIWGAIVVILGLVLITNNERLIGSPMLGVVLVALLILRLGWEVAQSRWQQLSEVEQLRIGSMERWITSVREIFAVLQSLFSSSWKFVESFSGKSQLNAKGKKWVRPDESLKISSKSQSHTERSIQETDSKNAPL